MSQVIAKGLREHAYAVDIVAWEALPTRPHAVPRYVGQLEKAPRMTDLAEVAWVVARRMDETRGLDLRTWLKSMNCSVLGKTDDAEESGLDPTRPAH